MSERDEAGASDGELLAGMTDGRIFHSADHGENWSDTAVQAGSILAMAALTATSQ